jgi:hypothetical protein
MLSRALRDIRPYLQGGSSKPITLLVAVSSIYRQPIPISFLVPHIRRRNLARLLWIALRSIQVTYHNYFILHCSKSISRVQFFFSWLWFSWRSSNFANRLSINIYLSLFCVRFKLLVWNFRVCFITYNGCHAEAQPKCLVGRRSVSLLLRLSSKGLSSPSPARG